MKFVEFFNRIAKTKHFRAVRNVSAVVEVLCWVPGYEVNRAAEMPPFHRLKQGNYMVFWNAAPRLTSLVAKCNV